MSTSLSDVVDEATRKAAQTAAAAAAPDAAAQAAAAQTALQEHFCRAIKGWCACTQDDSGAVETEFRLRESLIDAAVLTTWEGELQAKGYVVTRADGFFVVSLSA